MSYCSCLVFFFSSRRRHTRCSRDWSSDVCSSDLSWRIYRDVLVASFLINLFGLVSPFFVLIVYDRVIPNNAVETLWVLAIGITVIYVFAVLMRSLRGYFV